MSGSPYRVAVLGASGQLGSDLVSVLRSDGRYRVDAYARGDLDVRDGDAVDRAIVPGRYDAVVNTAALTNVDLCEEQGERALATNGGGAYLVARACARAGAKSVLIGTDFVFDGERIGPYRESDEPNPINLYGISKLCGERMAFHAAPDTLLLRISSVFGVAGSRGKGGNFVEAILAKARAGEPLKVVDDLFMSPTYTVDVARALLRLLETGAGGVVHLANSGSCSWFEFARRALRYCAIEIDMEPVPASHFRRPARRPHNSSLVSTRLESLIGESMPPWSKALRAYLEQKGHLPASSPAAADEGRLRPAGGEGPAGLGPGGNREEPT